MFASDHNGVADSRRARPPCGAASRKPRAVSLGRTASLVRGNLPVGHRDLFGGYVRPPVDR
jgi:hypothetical protein